MKTSTDEKTPISPTIRRFRANDERETQTVVDIWLNGNLGAHFFVDPNYWRGALPAVSRAFETAEIYVAVDASGTVRGFVGLDENRVLGLFVDANFRSRGIGAALVDYCKRTRSKLVANVYVKNERAVRFYRREGFEFLDVRVDAATGEREQTIVWKGAILR